jgi:ribosome-associated protein
LARLALPEILHEAVLAAQRMRSHGARTRQRQYIGKLMRQLEPSVLSRVRAALTSDRP